jgi:hypothetical protein
MSIHTVFCIIFLYCLLVFFSHNIANFHKLNMLILIKKFPLKTNWNKNVSWSHKQIENETGTSKGSQKLMKELRYRHAISIPFLVYTEFILVRLCRKLLAYKHTFESIPGTNQYWAMSVKFLAQGNNDMLLSGFEPMRLAS